MEQSRHKRPDETCAILIIAPQPFFQNRGTPIAVRLLAAELARLGHEVDLLVFHEGEDIELEGVAIHRIPAPPGVRNIAPSLTWKKLVCDAFMLCKAFAMMRRKKYRLMHAVEESAFLAMVLRLLFRVDYVYDMDSSLAIQVADKLPVLRPLRPFLEFFERAAVRQSCGVVAVCQALEEIARSYAPQKLIVRLEDISLLDEGEESDESIRDEYGIDGPIMLYVGNLEGYQGIDLLLEAFALALDKGAEGNVVIIGGSAEAIDYYRDKAGRLDIAGRTYFIGPRPVTQLGSYLAQADILLSPRIQGNNTPMKLYSYLDSGKAVLATDLPTHTQVLTPEVSCLVAPDKEAMADGMLRLLGAPEYCRELGARGKRLAEEKYSLPSFQAKLDSFYQQVAANLKKNQRTRG